MKKSVKTERTVTTEKSENNPSKNFKRVLVLGGAGFIGGNLCRTLLEMGATVHAVDNFITGVPSNIRLLESYPNFQFEKLDIISDDFKKYSSQPAYDHIFHLACPTGVPNIKTFGEEMLLTSSIGTRNVLELARIHKSVVLYTSTAEIYGDPLVMPQTENYTGNVNPIGPRSAYEEGKRFGEALVALYTRKYGVNAKIARIFNTYGPGMSSVDARIIPRFIAAALSGEPLKMYGDGTQTRTHSYVDDTVAGLITIITKGKVSEAYNVGGETPLSVRELGERIIAITKSISSFMFEPHFIEDHSRRQPSTQKLRNLGWEPTVTLDHGLERMITWFLSTRSAVIQTSQNATQAVS